MKKTVLITGVCGGIGAATAEAFVREGWQVIGVDCRPPVAALPALHFFEADLGDAAAFEPLFAEVAGIAGHLDALVNNAALQICKPLMETSAEEWDLVMAVNLRSVFLGMRHAYPLLLAGAGAVVNVGSVHARATSSNIAAYAASKGGLAALTRAAALEMAAAGIRVNGVHPGAVDTAMLNAGLHRESMEGEETNQLLRRLEGKHPLGRLGRPEEIAQAILFLADGKRSSFVTGQFLTVDGGALARLSTE